MEKLEVSKGVLDGLVEKHCRDGRLSRDPDHFMYHGNWEYTHSTPCGRLDYFRHTILRMYITLDRSKPCLVGMGLHHIPGWDNLWTQNRWDDEKAEETRRTLSMSWDEAVMRLAGRTDHRGSW